MRIALYHALYSGGALRTLSDQARLLRPRHSLHLFTLNTAEQRFAGLADHVDAITVVDHQPVRLYRSPFGRLNQLARMFDLRRLLHAEEKVARVIDQGGFDAVLAHPNVHTNGPAVLRFLRTPNVFYLHETLRLIYDNQPARQESKGGIRRSLDRIDPLPGMYRRRLAEYDRRSVLSADRVVVNSSFVGRSVRWAYGIDSVTCYHGVDTERFSPAAVVRGDYVMSVGALAPHKGFGFLVQSLARIPLDERPELIIVSNHAELELARRLTEEAAGLGVKLQLRIQVTDDELVDLYRRALVTVYAPINEPFGLVPLESMACATPVVAVGEGGVLETVEDGVTGRVVPRDPDAFARTVREMVGNPGLLKDLGCRGRERVLDKWQWSQRIECLETALEDVAAQGRSN